MAMRAGLGWLAIGWLIVTLSACNTMHGLGKDIERGGEKIQNASQ
ncbi:entericidin A/B family lipoprotein [Salinicola lusitanus]|nr:entericidin A/B family lipoprotein [Salinicola lusitanus]